MRPPQIVIGLVAALALAGAGFFVGMTVAQARTASSDAVTPAANASPARGAGGAGARQGGGQLGRARPRAAGHRRELHLLGSADAEQAERLTERDLHRLHEA